MLKWPIIRIFTKPAPAPKLVPVPVQAQPDNKPKGYMHVGKVISYHRR